MEAASSNFIDVFFVANVAHCDKSIVLRKITTLV